MSVWSTYTERGFAWAAIKACRSIFFLRIEELAAARNPVKDNEEEDDERIFHDEMDPEIAAIRDDDLK